LHTTALPQRLVSPSARKTRGLGYIWLAYRLHSLSAPKLVTWKALKTQFGAGFKELYHFKNRWPVAALELALAVYPAARVEVGDQGVVLRPSRPPVSPKLMQVKV
jgi:DMSO/TMAO reductase YedYZ heme-binding membrane subunit